MALADERGTIVLGGVEYPVKAFTLDQLQELMGPIRTFDRVATSYDEETGRGGPFDPEAIKAASVVVSVAVGIPTSELTGNVDELFVAVGKVKEVSGLVPLLARLAAMATGLNSTGTNSTPTS